MSQRLARRRAPTGPSARWWGMLVLAIGLALLLSCVPGLGLLAVLVAAPLLFYGARQDCRQPPRDYGHEPLNLAGQVAVGIGVLFASGAAFAGVCTPISFSLMYLPSVSFADEVAFVVFGLSLCAALAVLYAGYRTIRAASSPYTGGSALPEKFEMPPELAQPQPQPPTASDDSPK
ncbi:MAG: hypothetical protein AB7O68_18575 [Pirellulales bacterium]